MSALSPVTQGIPSVLDSYCHSCKSTTATENSKFFDLQKRHRVLGSCQACKKGKNSFIAKLNEKGERIHPFKPKVKRDVSDVGGSAFASIPLKRKRVRKAKVVDSADVATTPTPVTDDVVQIQ
jgi:hypothetical protein